MKLRLSVLDLSPVSSGSTPADALRSSVDLARHADALGLERYWLAEHHNAAAIASSAPEILIATIAAATTRIRVGSGGIMLPNHSPLKVAETFRALHALHPGRIDLGIGRAAGTDNKTALALRRSRDLLGSEGFEQQLEELLTLLTRDPDPAQPFGPVKAVPTGVAPPALWLLGSGGEGSALAARLGLGFAFAHHFAPDDAAKALTRYHAEFTPSERHGEAPRAILAVSAICGESDEHAADLARSSEIHWLRFGRGIRDLPLPSVQEAKAQPYDDADMPYVELHRARQIVGGPSRVADILQRLAEETSTSEIMATTFVHDPEERKRSYERIARALGG